MTRIYLQDTRGNLFGDLGKRGASNPITVENPNTSPAEETEHLEEYRADLQEGRTYTVMFTCDCDRYGNDSRSPNVQLFLMAHDHGQEGYGSKLIEYMSWKSGMDANFGDFSGEPDITDMGNGSWRFTLQFTVKAGGGGSYYPRLDNNMYGTTCKFWDITLQEGAADSLQFDVEVSDNSSRTRALMGGDILTLIFSLTYYKDIPIGSWTMFQGAKYVLYSPAALNKQGSRNIEYTLTMEAEGSHIPQYVLRDGEDGRLDFSMCAKPHEFVDLIVWNLNQRQGDGAWHSGECIEAEEKTLAFSFTLIADALQQVADEFETEWEIKDNTVYLRKVEYNKEAPLPLSYGKGNGLVPGIGRGTDAGEPPVETLYVQGGEQNIDVSKYVQITKGFLPQELQGSITADDCHTLHLPVDATLQYGGRTYKTDAKGRYVRRADLQPTYDTEGSVDLSDIYPSRVGEVGEVTFDGDAKCDFKDETIPDDLNFSDCVIAGEPMTVIFQTGMLAGKEFEIMTDGETGELTGYDHGTRTFKIVQQEYDGIMMPCVEKDEASGEIVAQWLPATGDKYAVFHCALPKSYIRDDSDKSGAEWDMFREAAKYLHGHEDVKFTFSGKVDGLWAKGDWANIGAKLMVGGYVRFSDPQFAPDGTDIRLTSIKDYVNDPHSPEVQLSDGTSGTNLSVTLAELKAQEVLRQDGEKRGRDFTRRRFSDAQRIMNMLNALVGTINDKFTNSVMPIAVQTMQTLVGDGSLQFEFVKGASGAQPSDNLEKTDLEVGIIESGINLHFFNIGNHEYPYLRHHTLGITEMSAASGYEYKMWMLPVSASYSALDADKDYYLYIKASATTENGTTCPAQASFHFSETAMPLQSDGYYYLLCGILNAEYEGGRSFAQMYGFTEILPGRITTDKITSTDGKTYFDLAQSIIGGNINFFSGGNYVPLAEYEAYNHRNLLMGSSPYTASNKIEVDNPNSSGEIWREFENELEIDIEAGKTYTLSYRADTADFGQTEFFLMWKDAPGYADNMITYHSGNGAAVFNGYKAIDDGNGMFRYILTFTVADNVGGRYYVRLDNNVAVTTLHYWDLQIEEGAYASPWKQPLDGNALLSLSSALEAINEAVGGSTEIAGGLLLTNMIMVKDTAGNVTGGLNGTSGDNVFLWSGGTYQQALAETVKLLLRKDGSGFFAGKNLSWDADGNIRVEGEIVANSGQIAGFDISNGTIGKVGLDSSGLSINRSFIKFSDSKTWAGLGLNVVSSSNGWNCLCRLEYNDTSNYSFGGYGLRVVYNVPKGNYDPIRRAIDATGNCCFKGGFSVFEDTYRGPAYSDSLTSNLKHTCTFAFNSISGAAVWMPLPTQADIENAIGRSDVTFLLQIQVAWTGNSNYIRVSGHDGVYLYNRYERGNGDPYGWLDIAQGDTLILRFIDGTYYVVFYYHG